MMQVGFLTVGSWRGVPLRLHWSTAIGAFLFSGFRVEVVTWLAFVGLVLLHELGHAVVIVLAGAQVGRIDVSGIGGRCYWQGSVSPIRRACIAWGGVWAQLLALAGAGIAVAGAGRPADGPLRDLFYVLTFANGWLVILNLVPVAPLDGAQAWRLFPLLWRRRRERQQGPGARARVRGA